MKYIQLSQNRQAIVDDQDFNSLNQHKWYFHHTGYAVRNIRIAKNKRKTIFLHRQIIPILDDQYIDHKDTDKLNCQRNNLRITTYTSNNANRRIFTKNTSGYKGVSQRKGYLRFRAYITRQGKRTYLGDYGTPLEAAKIYNAKAIELFGEFARLNVIDKPAQILDNKKAEQVFA